MKQAQVRGLSSSIYILEDLIDEEYDGTGAHYLLLYVQWYSRQLICPFCPQTIQSIALNNIIVANGKKGNVEFDEIEMLLCIIISFFLSFSGHQRHILKISARSAIPKISFAILHAERSMLEHTKQFPHWHATMFNCFTYKTLALVSYKVRVD